MQRASLYPTKKASAALMTPQPASTEFTGVLLVDHTSQPGGAELALPRIARNSRLSWKFVFLEPLSEELAFDEDACVLAPRTRRGLIGQALFLRRALRANAEHTVASNTLRAAFLVTLLKPRGQMHVQLLRDGVSPDSLTRLKRLVANYAFGHVTKILPNSKWTGRSVPSRFQALVSPPIYSPSGTDHVRASGQDQIYDGETLRLLSLSRVVEWKGLHIVLDALRFLADEVPPDRIELTVVGGALMGDEAYADRVRSAAAALPFRVSFLPHQRDVVPLLDRHDVLIHASTRPEPFGQVIVQGLSRGLAVVASRGGGPDELIQDGETGLLHEPGNARSLAASILRLRTEPATRARIAEAGARAAEAFSDGMCVALLDQELLGAMSTNRR
jgi:glycosyltransferase involved in cell wall biosynthesis